MQEGIETIGQFVVSGGDAPELLESIEEALDQMAIIAAVTAIPRPLRSIRVADVHC